MIGSLIGGALAVGSSIYGGMKASEAIRRARRRVEEQKRDNQNWYDRRYNEDSTQRADAQRVLSMTQENIRDRNRQAAGTAAAMGGTEESVAAAKEANNAALADAASQIAAAGDRRKDAVEQQYLSTKQGLNEQLNNMDMAKANATAQAVGGAAQALGAAGGAYDDYQMDKSYLAALGNVNGQR